MKTVLCQSPYCATDPETGEPTPLRAGWGILLCYPCRDRLMRQTGELPTMYAGDLEAALATIGRGGDPVSGTAERGLPINETVAEARAAIRRHLREWSDHVTSERGAAPLGVTGLALAQFLTSHTDWLAARAEAGDYAASCHDTWRQGMRAAYPSGTKRVPLGWACPMEGCLGEVMALIRPPEHRLPTAISCDLDPGHAWSQEQWKQLAPFLADQPRWLDTAQASALLNRKNGTVRVIAHRHGWRSFIHNGRAYYHPHDVRHSAKRLTSTTAM